MGTKNDKERAFAENSVLKFLVACCDEGPELEVSGTAIAAAYTRFYQESNKALTGCAAHAALLWDYTLYKFLLEAGFSKETREEKGSKGGTRKAVWFKGVALKNAFQFTLKPGEEKTVRVLPDKVQEVSGASLEYLDTLKRYGKPVAAPWPIAHSHIEVNGTLYERDLIATVKPIRGFVRHGSAEEMKALVTFRNAELRHQFVSAAEAARIKQLLEKAQ